MKVSELFESEVKYAIGEKIQTKVGGKWIDATISKPMNKGGNYGVRFKVGTTVMNYVSSPEEIRKKVNEGKEENIARLRKDYKNAMAWVNAPKSEVPDHERSKWEQQARKMRDHAKKQYHIDLNEGKIPTKTYGSASAKHKYEVEVYDEKTEWGDVVFIRANSQAEVEDFCSRRGWEVQGLQLDEAGRVFRSGADVTGEKPKAAEPVGDSKQFKKGQKVRVKKTGQEVEVLGFTKDGLVQTASTNPDDLAIKGWADFSHKELGGNLFNARGHVAYMPRELEEGWKMGAAAAALSAAVVAGIANSPKVEINGETYDKASSLRSAPADAKTATVTINGKKTKVLYWTAFGTKHNRKNRVYASVE